MKNKVEIVDNYLSKENFKIIEEITGRSETCQISQSHVWLAIRISWFLSCSYAEFEKNQIY